jgi:hypothetical protein
MKRKLSDAQRAAILAQPGHLSARDVANRLGLGRTAVAKVRREAAEGAAPPTTPADAAPPPAAPLPTDEQIAGASLETREEWLAMAGRSARAAEARGDMTAVARFGTLAASLYESIRKATPKQEQPEGYFMTEADQSAADASNEARFDALERHLRAERAKWPSCRTCSQPVRPADQANTDTSLAERLVSAFLELE